MSMTLSAIQLPLFTAPLKGREEPPAPEPPAPEPPAPEPPTPEPGIDFSRIDCPNKALLLPTLNPAAVATVVTGLIASSMTGAPASAALALTFNDTAGSLSYSFNPNDPNALVTATGTLGEAAYTENWAVNTETGAITVTGTIGESTQELTFSECEEQNAMFINGRVGDLAVSQKLFLVESQSGDESRSRLVVDGAIGGRSYHQELSLLGESEGGSAIGTSGYLAGSDLNQVILTSSTETGANTLAAGDVAGVEVTLNADLVMAQP
ncbi:MAG: hypothetical protein AMXMBFR33_71440 [Candidatus Xenobia bacterium]